MRDDSEARSIAGVVTELGHRFPEVPHVVIEKFVAEEYRRFDGAPVREYIPVMVKRSAKESLAGLLRESRDRFGGRVLGS